MNAEGKKRNENQVCVLWKTQGEKGGYFTGVDHDNLRVIGFYNKKKKNPNEPDLRVYKMDVSVIGLEFLSLWHNPAKDNHKAYMSGKISGTNTKVVGFINDEEGSKRPYITVVVSKPKEEREKEKQGVTQPPVEDERDPF